jgi:hypothetical protein
MGNKVPDSKTKSEALFERFLLINNLPFERIAEAEAPRPDYLVSISDQQLIFEIKELSEDEHFGVVDPAHPHIRSHSRTVGNHVRARIKGSRKQIQYGAEQGIPSILLIYNNLDYVFQDFGSSNLDFTTAMYGELTVLIQPRAEKSSKLFNGENQYLQDNKNTSFSAVGRLADRGGRLSVTLFENAFAKIPLPYDQLPRCFDARRVNISREALSED